MTCEEGGRARDRFDINVIGGKWPQPCPSSLGSRGRHTDVATGSAESGIRGYYQTPSPPPSLQDYTIRVTGQGHYRACRQEESALQNVKSATADLTQGLGLRDA